MAKNNNVLNYYGFVIIKTLKNNKIIKETTTHNSGTLWLFKLLAGALCGDTTVYNKMPQYFDLGVKDDEGNFTSHLYNRVYLSAKVIKDFSVTIDRDIFNGSYGASFTAMISSNTVRSSNPTKVLRLYSNSYAEDTLLAEVQLNDEISLNTAGGYNYSIEWVMTFENALEHK